METGERKPQFTNTVRPAGKKHETAISHCVSVVVTMDKIIPVESNNTAAFRLKTQRTRRSFDSCDDDECFERN